MKSLSLGHVCGAVLAVSLTVSALGQTTSSLPEVTPITEKVKIIETRIHLSEFADTIRNAGSICFGRFELVDFPAGSMSLGTSTVTGSGGTAQRFRVRFTDAAKARVYIYPADVARETTIASPCNFSEAARSKAILAGRVRSVSIRGVLRIEGGQKIAAVSLPPLRRGNDGTLLDGLHLELSDGVTAERPLLGGTVRQSGHIVVENSGNAVEVFSDGAEMKGKIAVRSKRGRMEIPIALQAVTPRWQPVHLDLIPGSTAEVSVDSATGKATLVDGRFSAASFSDAIPEGDPSEIAFGKAHVRYATLYAKSIEFMAASSRLTAKIDDVALAGVSGSYDDGPRTTIAAAPAATVKRIAADGSGSDTGVQLAPLAIEGLRLESPNIAMGTVLSVEGPGRLSVTTADRNGAAGRVEFDNATVKDTSSAVPVSAVRQLRIEGMTSEAKYAGTVVGIPNDVRLGTTTLASDEIRLDGEFVDGGKLRFAMNVARPGALKIAMPDGADAYTASVSGGSMAGNYSPTAGAVEFSPRAINVTIHDVVAVAGRVLGGKPIFAAAAASFANPETVSLRSQGVTGTLAFPSPAFSVSDPQLWSAARDVALALGGDLKGQGGTVVRTILGTGALVPDGGTLVRENIVVAPPDGITSVTLNLGGTDVEMKKLQIGRLELRPSFDAVHMTGSADIAVSTVKLATGAISRASWPIFRGTSTAPLSIERLSGRVEVGARPLELKRLEIVNGAFALKDVAFATPDGIQMEGNTADIRLARLNDGEAAGDFSLTGGRVHATGSSTTTATVQRLSLQFGGTKDAPLANGQLDIGGADVVADTSLVLHDECKNNPMPVRISAQTGAVSGPISIANDRTDFNLAVNDAHVQFFRPFDISNPYRCSWNHVLQPETSINHPCWDTCHWNGIPYPCNQHTCSSVIIPEIGVRYELVVNNIDASGTVTQLKIRPDSGKGIKFCAGHLTQLNPPVLTYSFSPTFTGDGAIAQALRDIVAAVVGSVQSGLTNFGLGPFLSGLSLLKIGDTFYMYQPCG
jgi:hypothetical protein